MKKLLISAFLLIQCMVYGQVTTEVSLLSSDKIDVQLNEVKKAAVTPIIDGSMNEAIWNKSAWLPIDQLWLGKKYDSEDFIGKYKLCWTNEALYVLVEVQDNVLMDQHEDPLKFWWDDDCVEVFIDEDNSGGEHQYNHNAFAYHVALDGNVVDMAPGEIPRLYNNHVESSHKTINNVTIWELKICIYDDTYNDNGENNSVKLEVGKKIGFAIAYCDNDNSQERENFIGSIFVSGTNKNRGWIDANIFGTILLTN
jgi:hypothetical protein